MHIYAIKPAFQKVLQPAANLFIHKKTDPTIINLLALLASLLTGLALAFQFIHPFLLLTIPVLVFIRIAFNALDGMVARGLQVASSKGEIYNEFFDRLSDIAIFIGLALFFIISPRSTGWDQIWFNGLNALFGFIFIILVLLNSYLGILSKAAGGNRIYTGLLGKADRMFYLGLAALIQSFVQNPLVWTIFYLFSLLFIIISIGQRLCKAIQS